MNLEKSVERILNAFLETDLDACLKDQVSKTSIGAIEKSHLGLFADLYTTSKCLSTYDGAVPNVSFIRTLSSHDNEYGDAILHSKNGILQYLELQFYCEKGWVALESASLV